MRRAFIAKNGLGSQAIGAAALAVGLLLGGSTAPALAQATDPCIGQLMLFGGQYCPRGYTEADGSLVSIGSNTALYSIYGTTYGGDGVRTFGLPDLRGRAPIGQGTGQNPPLPTVVQGQKLGSPTTTLTIANLPPHSHSVTAINGPTFGVNPSGQLLGTTPNPAYADPSRQAPVQMSPNMIGITGNGQPANTQSPVQALRWCVAVQGVFCSRQ